MFKKIKQEPNVEAKVPKHTKATASLAETLAQDLRLKRLAYLY